MLQALRLFSRSASSLVVVYYLYLQEHSNTLWLKDAANHVERKASCMRCDASHALDHHYRCSTTGSLSNKHRCRPVCKLLFCRG